MVELSQETRTEKIGDDFPSEALRFAAEVTQSIVENRSIHDALSTCDDAAYVKTSAGQVLATNAAYERLFAGPVSAVGRVGEDYLNKTILPVSKSSDDLILAGCRQVLFEHLGRDSQGRIVKLRTCKYSLLGVGHPKFAILGLTRADEVEQSNGSGIISLSEKYARFAALDARDRDIAVRLVRNQSVREIAAELGVSEKTIENRRKVIFEQMEEPSAVLLTKTLVRLQDRGFVDFGL